MRDRPTRFTTCCCVSAICRARRSRRACESGVADAGDRRARQDAAGARSSASPASERLHRRRGCGAVSRRDRRAAAAGPAGHAARAGRRSGRRSGAPLRPHAWTVHRARTSARVLVSASPSSMPRSQRLLASGRVVDGEFRPGGRGREWCDAEVLRTVRQRSLARLRQEVEPVEVGGARPLPRRLAFAGAAAIRARRPARRDRATAGRADRGVGARQRNPRRRASATIRRRCSTRCSAPARCRGPASSRSAIAMAASRSISPIT